MIESRTLTPFVPRLAVDLGGGRVPSWTALEGSMLSADISGFTALSEKLAGKGKAGAEEITRLINACFTALIDAAYAYGGEVVKFGGDALLVVFRGERHQRRAADAGLAMQRALRSSAAAKRAQLSMTVGIADGPFDAFVVGSGYRELLICGRRASEVIRLEGEAAKGDTLVSPSIAAHLPPSMCVRDEAGGVLVTGATGDAPTGPDVREPSTASLEPFVPREVVEQLAAFSELGGEHRLVTVGFVMVTGIAAQVERVGQRGVAELLTAVVDGVVEACDAFGVTVLHTDIANDGVKFVLCAGAPRNLGDSTDAMLQAALRITAIDSPFVIKQGVQAGRVFAGFLGSEHRRTYTLMGDPVNTAARMLGKAGDRDVVAVASAVRDTRTVFVTEELEPFTVKGKREPILAHRVLDVTGQVHRTDSTRPIFGREREIEVLHRAVRGGGAVVEVVGPPGVGKSRLLDAVWEAATGRIVHQAACTPYGVASPYRVFRLLLRSGLGIPADLDPEVVGARLREVVEREVPDLLPLLPLLAIPVGARVDPTAAADAIDPAFRRVRIHELMTQFLDAVVVGPVLLVVEDAHWIDEASGDLLNHLVTACASRPWSIVVTRRPEGSWTIADGAHVSSLTLGPLDDAAVHRLAIEVSERPLLDRDLATIAERAQGNPLFAIELTRALADPGAELPETVEQIIAGRLDRLEPTARHLVRVAAVVGSVFDESMVAGVDGVPVTVAERALTTAAAAGVIGRRSGPTWAFVHALYRDAAYAGLPFARRRLLHRQVAEAFEARTADTDAVAPLLSLHYTAARVHDRAWTYSLRAGSAAKAQQATSDAADAFERALHAGRYAAGVSAAQRAEVAEELGDLCYVLGRFDRATDAYRTARRLRNDPIARVALVRKIGAVHERRGRPDRALHWYARAARAIPADTADLRWAVARAEVSLAEAGIRARRNENERCLALATAALADAERAGDRAVEAIALERIHLALTYLRRADDLGAGPRALALHRELADHSGTARTLINLGIEAYFGSRWTDAGAYYLEALETAQRAGSVVLAATAAINSAEILSDQGDWSRAVELFDSARRNYAAVGYAAGVAAATMFAAVALTRDGRLDDAAERLDTARGLFTRLAMADLLDELDTRALELDLLAGRATLDACAALLARFGSEHPCVGRVHRVTGVLHHLAGDTSSARAALDAALAADSGPGLDRAIALRTLVELTPDDDRVAVWRDEADAICRSLGVVRTPPVPRLSPRSGPR